MTDNTVKIVLTSDVLGHIPESENQFISFLRYWISDNDTKGVVTLSAWKEFESYWNRELSNFTEVRNSFFYSMRGLLTPYRTKYADEAGIEIGEIDKQSMELDEKTIVNWHYASVRYLISDKAEELRSNSQDIKISTDSILTPKEFYNKLEVDDEKIIEKFKQTKLE